MLTGYFYPTTYPRIGNREAPPASSEISRLLAAAVVNKNFRELLLRDPSQALAQGYRGESFSLSPKERELVISIQAGDLNDFALQITSQKEREAQSGRITWIPTQQDALAFGP